MFEIAQLLCFGFIPYLPATSSMESGVSTIFPIIANNQSTENFDILRGEHTTLNSNYHHRSQIIITTTTKYYHLPSHPQPHPHSSNNSSLTNPPTTPPLLLSSSTHSAAPTPYSPLPLLFINKFRFPFPSQLPSGVVGTDGRRETNPPSRVFRLLL